jgi:hypothetical protein
MNSSGGERARSVDRLSELRRERFGRGTESRQNVTGPRDGPIDDVEPRARLGDGTLRSAMGVSPRGHPDAYAPVARGAGRQRSGHHGTLSGYSGSRGRASFYSGEGHLHFVDRLPEILAAGCP